MARQHWLVKQEPTKYPFSQLQKDKKTTWDGVRNHQARNNLAAMKKGDGVLYYHSVIGTEVVGICEVSRESFPDPSADDPRWVAVEIAATKALPHPVGLAEIKQDPALQDMALLRQSRLSVMPVTKAEFDRIVKLGTKGNG
ncbi:MAG: EVE domain-containing protein [Deltaproteobacteria bacterium]|nr:EVE domain-containing protein [Deltaproteobacteria bacterium]